MPRICYLITQDWYYVSHREALAMQAKKQGFDVNIITQVEKYKEHIKKTGVKLIEINFYRSIKNIFHEFLTIKQIYKAYRNTQPDIIHQVSLKPCLYGSIAIFFCFYGKNKPIVINAFTGLGYVFTSSSFPSRLLRLALIPLFRLLFKQKNMYVVFQNKEDEKIFIQHKITNKNHCYLISGSGVNISQYSYEEQEPEGNIVVMLVARMLIEKGIYEFVDAAKIIKKEYENIRFVLVGGIDCENPSGISQEKLQAWQEKGIIEWWKKQDDMPKIYNKAHMVVLPSYREGLPKVLLEAAASGKPIITTDVPGCRDAIISNETGILVSPKDTNSLVKAIKCLINNKKKRKLMGQHGRKLVEEKFAMEIINDKFLKLYRKLLKLNNKPYLKN